MHKIQTDILVIGGGATGTGILRDLAMRGFNCVLVERRDLAYGTTGRYHGLLHSGGRYVVKDPQAAQECIEENKILRRIMPQCIEDTGGFFVLTSEDDPAYPEKFLLGCKLAGVPVEELSHTQMIKEEPVLNPEIQRCFRVPDASADSFMASALNAVSARNYSSTVLTYHEVNHLIVDSSLDGSTQAVHGAICHDLVKDEDIRIDATMIVNASGAWAGNICQLAGITLRMVPGKGTMIAVNHRVVNTVINRCKLPADGDILVPAHTVAVMGTTDIKVSDPDHYSIEPWEIRLMLDEGEKIIPGFKQFRILRAWAGVRPLIDEDNLSSNRDLSRAYTLIDHTVRDGIDGLVTITSGKWTTYRKMAEVTVNKVCEKLGTVRQCRTHLETLPGIGKDTKANYYLGSHLHEIEREEKYGQLVCECELVSRADVEKAIIDSNAVTIDDIRRDVRLGMGPCQAAFCAFRAAGMMHHFRRPSVRETNDSLRNFLEERWKGNVPILWGQQLRQLRFNELVYLSNLNVTSLPVQPTSRLKTEIYQQSSDAGSSRSVKTKEITRKPSAGLYTRRSDIVVIGAGIAGLVAGWRASTHCRKTSVISKGWGTPYWGTGCIDIFGYQPPEYTRRVDTPIRFLESFIKAYPEHPYAIAGLTALEESLTTFLAMSVELGYPYFGSLQSNFLLPTSLGTLRPTCLAPRTMIAGDARQNNPMLIVGFDRFFDFYPDLIADNLNEQGLLAQPLSLDLKTLHDRKIINSMVLARLFDDTSFCQEVVDAIKPKLGQAVRVGFPAILGLKHAIRTLEQLENALGVPVFEIPGLPPSIPGIRLQNLLVSAIERNNGEISQGMEVLSSELQEGRITRVLSQAPVRAVTHHAQDYILATGGVLGGGITTDDSGYAQETIFGFQIDVPGSNVDQFQQFFLSSSGHPIFSRGIHVDANLHAVAHGDQSFISNLYITGGLLANCDPIRERSLEGVALVSGYKAGEMAGRSHECRP